MFEELMGKAIILDGRNCFDLKEMEKCNVIYESMGRPIVNQKTTDFQNKNINING